MNNKKHNNYFRRISHPRQNLILPPEAINHLKSKDKPIPAVNPEAVYMELLNYFDPYDVGLDIGHKKIGSHPIKLVKSE